MFPWHSHAHFHWPSSKPLPPPCTFFSSHVSILGTRSWRDVIHASRGQKCRGQKFRVTTVREITTRKMKILSNKLQITYITYRQLLIHSTQVPGSRQHNYLNNSVDSSRKLLCHTQSSLTNKSASTLKSIVCKQLEDSFNFIISSYIHLFKAQSKTWKH